MLVVKGVNFFPQSLLSVIPEFEPRISREFRVVRPKEGRPEAVRVIMETGVEAGSNRDRMTSAIQRRVAEMLQVKIAIEWQPVGKLPRERNKVRLVVDDPASLGH